MVEWVIVDKKGNKRKAKPKEIPQKLEHGVSYRDGKLIPKATRKRGVQKR